MIPVGELFEQKMTLVHFVPSRSRVTDTLKSEGERKETCVTLVTLLAEGLSVVSEEEFPGLWW